MLSYDPKRLYYKKLILFTRSVALIKLEETLRDIERFR
jgi:hypothetical protein